jgi:hypothetical protein
MHDLSRNEVIECAGRPALLPCGVANIGVGARADRDHHDVIGSKADHRTEGIWHRERLPAAEVPRDFLSG